SMDRYGRTVAKVYVGKTYVNAEMLRSGAAWWYQQYAPHDTDLAEAESTAKHNHTGLWAMPDPLPPWKFRRTQ
ncbi:MAG: thermonuclease family protein, partial [Victivallaceae bacterium]|nr:thermonuclease family protein [Victivallaceae bacterium]